MKIFPTFPFCSKIPKFGTFWDFGIEWGACTNKAFGLKVKIRLKFYLITFGLNFLYVIL